MKTSLAFPMLFVGLFGRGFASGPSTSLRGNKHNERQDQANDLASWLAVEEQPRSRRPKAVHGRKIKSSKKSNSHQGTNTKQSSKKGSKTNNIFIRQPANNMAVDTTGAAVVPAKTTTVVPTKNNSSVPTNNNDPLPVVPTNQTDLLQPCNEAVDCLNDACGFETLESRASGKKVCCPSGKAQIGAYPIPSDLDMFCTQPLGAPCGGSDEFCISGICARDKCVDGLQPDGASCDSPDECSSGVCARGRAEETSPLVCCPQGVRSVLVYVLYDPYENTACAEQPTGAPCWTVYGQSDNEICASGKCVNYKCA